MKKAALALALATAIAATSCQNAAPQDRQELPFTVIQSAVETYRHTELDGESAIEVDGTHVTVTNTKKPGCSTASIGEETYSVCQTLPDDVNDPVKLPSHLTVGK